jgi:hypothetical protein
MPFSITFKIRATPASFRARTSKWKSAIRFAATFCNSPCASSATASWKRAFCAAAVRPRSRALHFLPSNYATAHSLRPARSLRNRFRKRLADFLRQHFTARNLPQMRLKPYCEISPQNIASYSARPVARSSVSGSFRFKTQPSSLVGTSKTSAAWAQTTARAPLSTGACSNSS